MEFIMLVGLPGSGKSTRAKEYKSKGYIIHSLDAIRNELNLHSLDDTQTVIDILNDRVVLDMKLNKNIVYDSTNLTRKRRMSILKMIEDFNYNKICEVMLVPIDICKERNSKRTGHSRVPDREYDILINRYNFPMSDEGWDAVKIHIYDDKVEIQ